MKQPTSVADAIVAGSMPLDPALENHAESGKMEEPESADIAAEEVMSALEAKDPKAFREALRSLLDIMGD